MKMNLTLMAAAPAGEATADVDCSSGLHYSTMAEKKVAVYLAKVVDMKLGGHDNSFTRMMLNNAAADALTQILIDNPALTGYAAALETIELEKAA